VEKYPSGGRREHHVGRFHYRLGPMESGSTPPETDKPEGRLAFLGGVPRGAIAVVIVGVIATIAAALLTGGHSSDEAAHLEWVQQRKVPDSKAVDAPGGNGSIQMVDGSIMSTGSNIEGYSLFRVVNTFKIDKGVTLDGGKIVCSVHAITHGTEIAQSEGGLRMLYPRSSETGIYGQPVEERVVANHFASHNFKLAVLEVGFDMPERYTSIMGVKPVEWGEYEVGTEHLIYHLPEGAAPADVELPFYTIWKSRKPPAALTKCELVTSAGKATASQTSKLAHVGRPINEEEDESEGEALQAQEEEEGAAGQGAGGEEEGE
jgi:hypothetical protein